MTTVLTRAERDHECNSTHYESWTVIVELEDIEDCLSTIRRLEAASGKVTRTSVLPEFSMRWCMHGESEQMYWEFSTSVTVCRRHHPSLVFSLLDAAGWADNPNVTLVLPTGEVLV